MDAGLWADEFDSEIEESQVLDNWKLHVDEDLQIQMGWLRYTQRSYGKFRCSRCRRSWKSAEIHVLFLMNLNKVLRQGTVRMRIFKQECKKCIFPVMEKAEISHENIKRIIINLANRIQQVFYGQRERSQNLKPEVYGSDMEGPHDKEHCEGCKLQICGWQIVTPKGQADKGKDTQSKPKGQADKGKETQSKPKGQADKGKDTQSKPKGQADKKETQSTPHQSWARGLQHEPCVIKSSTKEHRPRHESDTSADDFVGFIIGVIGIGVLALWLLNR
ncbi:receptor-transporting protein 3-like [Mixophyes fleayi]|uniref:receptor-transporting protein 3-like n=1 Tax=Mixophyes fleayi TaxID=3061075 RepID=UPI003F4DD2A5